LAHSDAWAASTGVANVAAVEQMQQLVAESRALARPLLMKLVLQKR
jgi:hypothetical protein